MKRRGEDVPEEEQEQEDLIETAKFENARKKASEVLKACMLSKSVSSSVCRRKFKETLLSLKKPVAEDEEAPEEDEKDEFDGERDMKREAMRAASEILQACRSDPTVLLKSKCFSKAREELNLRSGFQKNDEQEVDEDSMRRDLKREAFKNAPKLMKECMAKRVLTSKHAAKKSKLQSMTNFHRMRMATRKGVEDISSSLEEAAKRSAADVLRSCLRGAQKSASSARRACKSIAARLHWVKARLRKMSARRKRPVPPSRLPLRRQERCLKGARVCCAARRRGWQPLSRGEQKMFRSRKEGIFGLCDL